MPENDRFLAKAIAFLEIGSAASEFKTSLKDDYDYQNAMAYQLYHAIELFYKHMILKKKTKISYIHDLSKLESEYLELYPQSEYRIEHPFDFTDYQTLNQNESKKIEQHLRNFKPCIMDQHLRYPSDHNTGGYSFFLEPSVFSKTKNEMLKISALTQGETP